jgi:osmoprotectant transport system permease protein
LLIDGLRTRDYPQMAAGAVLVAVLALLVEAVLALVQRQVVSPGLRAGGGARRSPTAEVAWVEPDAGSAPSTTPELAGAQR